MTLNRVNCLHLFNWDGMSILDNFLHCSLSSSYFQNEWVERTTCSWNLDNQTCHLVTKIYFTLRFMLGVDFHHGKYDKNGYLLVISFEVKKIKLISFCHDCSLWWLQGSPISRQSASNIVIGFTLMACQLRSQSLTLGFSQRTV